MNIWNYISSETTKLEELLEKEDTTLEQVLDDESVISELKNLNHKLLEFLTPERILKMLEYVTVEPPEDSDQLRGYKLPYISSELLISEVSVIMNSFFPVDEPKEEFGDFQEAKDEESEEKNQEGNEGEGKEKKEEISPDEQKLKDKALSEELLRKLFSVIENDNVNPVLSGYFAKIIKCFINRNPYEVHFFIHFRSFCIFIPIRQFYQTLSEILMINLFRKLLHQ